MVSCLLKRNRLIIESRGWEEYVAGTASTAVLEGLGELLKSQANMVGNETAVLSAAGTSVHPGLVTKAMLDSHGSMFLSTLPFPMISPASHCFLIWGQEGFYIKIGSCCCYRSP